MTISDSNLTALENKARRAGEHAAIELTRNEALSLLVELRQLRAERRAMRELSK